MKISLSLVLGLLVLGGVALTGCGKDGDVPGEEHPLGYGMDKKMERPQGGQGKAMAEKMGYKMPAGAPGQPKSGAPAPPAGSGGR